MGTCFGHFGKRSKAKRHVGLHRCFYYRDKAQVEFELLVDGDGASSTEFIPDAFEVWCTSTKGPSNHLSKHEQKPTVKKWLSERGENSTHEGESTQLLPLDAHSLLASRALQYRKISWSSSTPPSSIDLEWENEGGITHVVPRLKSQRSSSSNIESSSGDCGGGSPESLEWDPGTDNDTDQLLSEIERLTSRALQETGIWSAASQDPL